MMGIGTNTQKPDEGEMHRDQEAIACCVWFTSSGSTLPKMFKFQDENGALHTVDNIRIYSQEKKRYCGIPVTEYRCSTLQEGYEYIFRIYYYLEDGCWKIAWNC